jgi:hypothetical protein
MSGLTRAYPASYSVVKDGSFTGDKAALSCSAHVKKEWSCISTLPISPYGIKGDVFCQLNTVICFAEKK